MGDTISEHVVIGEQNWDVLELLRRWADEDPVVETFIENNWGEFCEKILSKLEVDECPTLDMELEEDF